MSPASSTSPATEHPLAGRTVVVTRPADQSRALVASLRRMGARPIVAPALLERIAMPMSTPSSAMIESVRTSDPSGSPSNLANASASSITPKADHTIVTNSHSSSAAANAFEI